MSFEYWLPENYKQQWSRALQRVAVDEVDSALITSLTDPRTANFFSWWPVYRNGADVVFQNSVLLLNELSRPFELSRFEEFIPERQERSEDGQQISEWRGLASEVLAFLARS